MNEPIIRRATSDDVAVLVDFNKGIARETEGKELKHDVITNGVASFLKRQELGFYIVAEVDSKVVGSLMITKEWSDWRNGLFWWIQSVYIVAEHRRQGIYRGLYDKVKQLADDEPDVCGFRLYVERENEIAQQTYSNLGMEETDYLMFEELKPGTDWLDS